MVSTTRFPPGPLRVENVGVSAGGTRILQMVDLTLHPGEMCALIGPSGAGKSTLIKALLGLRDPDKGSVMMGSLPMAELGPVGYVPQDDALHRGLTVRRELAYAAELRMPEASAEERQSRIAEVLDQVDLGDRAEVRIRRLSGGQRKRVSLALELLTGPPLLILDEPTSGLDPGLEARTMTLLSQVAGTGRIVLVATHAMESIERAEALCVLVGGHVAFLRDAPKCALVLPGRSVRRALPTARETITVVLGPHRQRGPGPASVSPTPGSRAPFASRRGR